MVRILRVWFAILVLLGSVIGSVRIGPVAVLAGLVDQTRGEWGIGASDSAEDASSQWALLGSKRNLLRTSDWRPNATRRAAATTVDCALELAVQGEVQHRPLPRVLFRRSLPSAEEPPPFNS